MVNPPKSPQAMNTEALENAKFFAQIQSDKDRRTIKIRLAQMTKQFDKIAKLPSEYKTNHNAADVILNKVRGKRKNTSSTIHTLSALPESMKSLDTPSKTGSLSAFPFSSSNLDSRRGSQKTVSNQEFTGLYAQKLLKGRPPVPRTVYSSPKSSSTLQPQSLIDIAPQGDYLLVPPKNKETRGRATIDARSLQDMKITPSVERGVSQNGNNCESATIQAGSTRKTNFLENIFARDSLISSPIGENCLSGIGEGRFSITNGGSFQRKGSPRVNFTTITTTTARSQSKGGNSKENSVYTQLHEVKEWRKRVFKKPEKRASILNSRTLNLNINQKRASCVNIEF